MTQSDDNRFEKGRKSTLRDIRAYIDGFDPKHYATIIAKDHMLMYKEGTSDIGFTPDEADTATIVVELALEPAYDYLKRTMLAAVDNLLHGTTVYEFTDTLDIYGYKHITDGDYEAGVRSAALDMQMLMFTLDTENMTADILQQIQLPDEAKKSLPTITAMIRGGYSGKVDGVLSTIEERHIEKAKHPKVVAFEGGEIQPMPKDIGARILWSLVHHSYRHINMRTKTPALWPATVSGQQGNDTLRMTWDDFLGKPESEAAMPDNENEDFSRGFNQGLEAIYNGIQTRHFHVRNREIGGYETSLRKNGYSGTVMSRAIDDAFSELRFILRSQFDESAKGEGTSYEEGIAASIQWAGREIRQLTLPGSLSEDPKAARTLHALRKIWCKEISGIGSALTSPEDALQTDAEEQVGTIPEAGAVSTDPAGRSLAM